MSFNTPWTDGSDTTQHQHQQPAVKMVPVDTNEFVRTRDALTSAYLGLSASLDRAVKAYLDHTQVVLNGDASLNISHLLQPFNAISSHAQMAQMALATHNGTGAPTSDADLAAALAEATGPDGKKKRAKRAYKQRDPDAPKRPLTAYFRFLGDARPAIQKEMAADPGAFGGATKPGDISKVATERWNKLGKEEQAPYREAYQEALKDYEKATSAYKAEGKEGVKKDESEDSEDEGESVGKVEKGKVREESTDSDSSSESESEDEAPAPPPQAKTPKSSKKAGRKAAAEAPAPPQPMFSSITAPTPAKTSPELKRKAGDDEPGTAKKKRGRKSNAEKAAMAAAGEAPASTPSAGAEKEANEPETEGKKKKEKKRKAKGGEA